jgi:hypothetical protein
VSERLRELGGGSLPEGSVVFLGKTPYSAYYNLGPAVKLHTKETFASSLSREARFYVCKKKDAEDLPEEWRSSHEVVSRVGGWLVLTRGGKNDVRGSTVAASRAGP